MSKKRILIVEDEYLVAFDIQNRLIAMGYETLGPFAKGMDVLGALKEEKVDLLLMDIKIKGDIDGLDTAVLINKRYDIPIVYLTAYSDSGTLERALGTDAYGYILKPFEDRELQIGIEIALYKHSIQKKLEEEKERAERANKTKSIFLANMSHELRTPLNSIIGMADLSLDMAGSDEQRQYLSILKQSAGSLLFTINSILDYSRLDEDEGPIVKETFNPADLVEEIGENIAPQAGNKNISFILDIEDDIRAFFIGDKGRIRRIITNLVENAVKFSNDGEIVLRTWMETSADTSKRLHILVKDRGIGITRENLGKIFGPFTQLDNSNTREYGGTGIGLAIVKKLTEKLGGEIQVRSEPGMGTEFELSIPISQEEYDQSEGAKSSLPEDIHVFLVHHSENLASSLESSIRSRNAAFSWFRNSDEALSVRSELTGKHIVWLLEEGASGTAHCIQAIKNGTISSSANDFIIISKAGRSPKRQWLTPYTSIEVLYEPVLDSELYQMLTANRRGMKSVRELEKSGGHNKKRPYRVLLVEDDKINRLVNRKMLQKVGHEVIEVENGKKALDTLSKTQVDYILMDIQMPDMDGLEATKKIRSGKIKDLDRDIPIMALTAHALEEDRLAAVKSGMDGFISKPFSPENLYLIIEQVLKQREKDREKPEHLIEEFEEKAKEFCDSEDIEALRSLVAEYSGRMKNKDPVSEELLFRMKLACRKHDLALIMEILENIKVK